MQWELVSGSVTSNTDGTVVLSSAEDAVFNLFIRNPQGYAFTLSNNMSYSFDKTQIENAQNLFGVTVDGTTDGTTELYQPEDEIAVLVLRYSKDFLNATETGFDISPTVTLKHPVSGVNFGDYTALKVKCNSAPPPLYGAVVYKDTVNQKYVILFNMPQNSLLTGIHQDIKSISVNKSESEISINSDGTFTFANESFDVGNVSASYSAGASDFVENGQPAVFYTDDTISDEVIEYSLILKDKEGFTTEVKTNITSVRLEKVSIQDSEGKTLEDGTSIAQDEGLSYATINFIPAATAKDGKDTSDAIIVYEVYQGTDDTGKIIYSGKNSGGKMVLMLPAGQNLIRIYSHKDLYADSIPTDYGLKVLKSTLYVSSSGSDTENNGSKSSPFLTVTHAISSDGFDDITEENNLRVSGEIADSPEILTQNTNLTVTGLTSSDSIENLTMNADGGVVKFNKINIKKDLTLTNGSLALSNVNVNGSVTVGGGSLTLKESTTITEGLTLSSGCTINIENLSAENVATIKGINEWTLGTTVLTGKEITLADCLKFTIEGKTTDGQSLCLVPSEDKTTALLALKGVSTTHEFGGVTEYTLSLSPTEFVYGKTNTITLTVKQGETTITPDSVTYLLYQNKSYVASADLTGGVLPSWVPTGKYTVVAVAKIGSSYYETEQNITIKEE